MKKIHLLVTATFLLIANSALCKVPEWVKVGADKDGSVMYIDKNNIARNGNKVKAWILFDFLREDVVGNIKYKSEVDFNLFDCNESTMSIMKMFYYSDSMQGGDLVYTSKEFNEPGKTIMPGTMSDAVKDLLCSKS